MAPPAAHALDERRMSSTPPTSRARIYGSLALGVLCIAFSAIFTRWAGVPGPVSALWRVALAALVLAPAFGLRLARHQIALERRVWLLAAGAGLFFAFDLGLWNTSLLLTSAADATLLGNDAPIVVGLGALLIFRERLRTTYWLGLGLALAGMLVIAGPAVLTQSRHGSGDLLALAGGAAYGCYMLTTQRVRARMDTLSALWVPAVACGVLLLVFNLASHQALWGFSTRTYLALLALSLVSQVAGWLAITYALGHLPASSVSVTLVAQPVLTALLAVPLLGEGLKASQILGGAVALTGIYLVNRGAFAGKAG